MAEQNKFKNDSFADLWAKVEFVVAVLNDTDDVELVSTEAKDLASDIIYDLYSALETSFGDDRIMTLADLMPVEEGEERRLS